MRREIRKKKVFIHFLIVFFVYLFGLNPTEAKSEKKILVVMSSSDTLELEGGIKYPTGVFLNELFLPIHSLKQEGYIFEFATPNGKRATIDPESVKDKYWDTKELKDEAIAFTQSNESFLNPKSLPSVLTRTDEFVALMIPGGQGLMMDLLYDSSTTKIILNFHKNKKSIGLICHAPALLTSFSEAENPFYNYKVNSVTKMEEWFIETFVMKGTQKVRKISSLLKEKSLLYESSFFPGQSYAVRDQNLVTSQNPFSGKEFVTLFRQSILESLETP